jgi:hypothetical protein
MKSIFVAAIIAAACSGVALAGELKQDQKTAAPGVKAQAMSDAEMDKVTAGDFVIILHNGLDQPVGSGGQSFHRDANQGFNNSGHRGACFNCGG